MKKWIVIAGVVASSVVLTGCNQSRSNLSSCDGDVVEKTFVHKYGVTVSKNDWKDRGKDGQIVNKCKDGVTVTKNYRGGVLDGIATYTYPHSQTLHHSEVYAQGVLMEKVSYYPSGLPFEEVEYTSPGCKIVTSWYEAGTLQSTEGYEANKLVWAKYYNGNQQVESEVVDGVGLRIRRDSFGALLSHDNIYAGEMTVRTTFHPNGAPESVSPFDHGTLTGLRKTYLPEGEPNSMEEWFRGEQHGITTVFLNGEKYAEIPYQHGKKCGVEKRYRDGAILQEEVSWKDGNRTGPTRSYVGADVKTDWYHQGKQVSKVTFERLNGTLR